MKKTNGKVGAIIVAAGSSRRMGAIDKIFARINGEPLLAKTVSAFHNCRSVDEIVVVLSKKNMELGRKLIKERNWPKVVAICPGGLRRQDSVKEGLRRLTDCEWVVVHDGARPCIGPDIIERGLVTAKDYGSAIAGVPVKDTIKIVSRRGIVQQTPTRECLWAAQTPQVFRYKLLAEAYDQTDEEVTDDATLVEKLGHKVEVYLGSYHNIKVTTPEDLAVAEVFLQNKEPKKSATAEALCASESDTTPIG
ncbi:MAG: 2-C-methyl-D-erythritol 4-phosphate cytidylyltransferase [Chloroflexi bacterium]|nr:2-C-methyl-D-erythritol 4-phosphate cytidylyltransferase [Chloroflexota bacterium]